jgi:hypothetical protein
VIRIVQREPSMGNFVVSEILQRLLSKQVWTDKSLWKGFGKCCATIGAPSYSLLLGLPPTQLSDQLGGFTEVCNCSVVQLRSVPVWLDAIIDTYQ